MTSFDVPKCISKEPVHRFVASSAWVPYTDTDTRDAKVKVEHINEEMFIKMETQENETTKPLLSSIMEENIEDKVIASANKLALKKSVPPVQHVKVQCEQVWQNNNEGENCPLENAIASNSLNPESDSCSKNVKLSKEENLLDALISTLSKNNYRLTLQRSELDQRDNPNTGSSVPDEQSPSENKLVENKYMKTDANLLKFYICHICRQAFDQLSKLRTHFYTCKRKTCKICGKIFTQYSSLVIHTRIHFGEKPYMCEHCGVNFTQSGHLKAHLRSHAPFKPFLCEVCGKIYRYSFNFSRHKCFVSLTS